MINRLRRQHVLLFVPKCLLSVVLLLAVSPFAPAGTKTRDGKYDTENIEVTVVYFVPADRRPLPDWRDRVDYFCRRIELFHAREFQGQSTLKTVVHVEPFISQSTTAELRSGDANAIYSRTLQETDGWLGFAQGKRESFPILLVLSEINWRPLDDFYRLKPQNGKLVFEGNYTGSEHFPEPGNGSVMSLGQYRGWINESWLDKDQKVRLGWKPQDIADDTQNELFSRFLALPQPRVPQPGQSVQLALDWPDDAEVKSLRVRFQTSVDGPWINVPQAWEGRAPRTASLGAFDRETPVSYRVDTELEDGVTAECWGYFQVRRDPQRNPQPFSLSPVDFTGSRLNQSQAKDEYSRPSRWTDLGAASTTTIVVTRLRNSIIFWIRIKPPCVKHSSGGAA